MGVYNKQVKNLKGVPVVIQAMQDGELKEIPLTVKDVFLAVLNDYRPVNISELSVCITATRKIQKDDENLDEDEIKKLVDLIIDARGLAMYTILFVLDAMAERYPEAKEYIESKLSKKQEAKDKKIKRSSKK